MPAPNHSRESILLYPAPNRDQYFNGRDYAMACLRIHNKRVKFDGPATKVKVKKPVTN